MPERLTPPWPVEETGNDSFKVSTADGVPLLWVCYDDRPMMNRLNDPLTKEQARKLAGAISRIPTRQWPADVKAGLLALQERLKLEGVPEDFDAFVQWFVRDALIGMGAVEPYFSDEEDR